MCINKGKLSRDTITVNEPNYSLEGKMNPSIKVVGLSDVIIDGEVFKQGETFLIEAPGVVLEGTISIQFLDKNKDNRNVLVRYIAITTN